jgi:hypothetical protein
MTTEAKTYPIIPSWEAVLPLYISAIASGGFEARRAAKLELERMAKLADAYVALTKKDQAND